MRNSAINLNKCKLTFKDKNYNNNMYLIGIRLITKDNTGKANNNFHLIMKVLN